MAVAAQRANLVFGATSPVLMAAQRFELFDDCKDFVDALMLSDPEEILRAFEDVDACDEAAVRAFVALHFGEVREPFRVTDPLPLTRRSET